MGKVTSSKDLVMLLLYARGHSGKQCEPIRGRTRLVKMIFLFVKEVRKEFNLDKCIPEKVLPKFTAYDYGPFSSQIYSDIEFLTQAEFVLERAVTSRADLLPEETFEYGHWIADSATEEEPIESKQLVEFHLTALGREFVKEEFADLLSAKQWDALNKFKKRCTSASLRALLQYVYKKYEDMTTNSKIRDEILSDYD